MLVVREEDHVVRDYHLPCSTHCRLTNPIIQCVSRNFAVRVKTYVYTIYNYTMLILGGPSPSTRKGGAITPLMLLPLQYVTHKQVVITKAIFLTAFPVYY